MQQEKQRLVVILGTRAELIKTAPLIKEIQNRQHPLKFIHTGQHNLKQLCEKFNIPQPDITLSKTPEESSKFKGSKTQAIKWNITLINKIRKETKKFQPDHVIYHGDTMSTVLAAFSNSRILNPLRKYNTAHIEAGLRSGSIKEPFPEEIARIKADLYSTHLYTVSKTSENNLRHHKLLGKKVKNTGNTIVDTVNQTLETTTKQKTKEDYAIATVHRHENINSKQRLTKITQILTHTPIKTYFPLHDNTKQKLEEYQLLEKIQENEKIEISPLKDYPEFLKLLRDAKLAYTDGGSIQEESLIFKTPCIILRNKTERKEGLKTPLNYLSKLRVEPTVEKAREFAKTNYKNYQKQPYGQPGVSKKIIDDLTKKPKLIQ